ncbi:hypothetical protein K450DRAFT_301538 [Umbelopsis ramanniana AG]|uniref:Uncharacterized protein n=1 Tax=Umbelopsis ramanniana AG TaxID=1314678 RepID=A0AAD5HCT5_UMBRA|nr:uncharacterized protein K450DRAFT_301538 [Umbelopsis ramanniana AG]KAI8577861.1 hypothetical protein K450DRAFT_301538 [Umbelopsis ramanniana AG]
MGDSGNDKDAQALKAKEKVIQSTISTSHNLPPPSPSPRSTGPPDDNRESIALFQKLDQGDTNVSFDSIVDERNNNINDPSVEDDEELLKRVQKQPQDIVSSSDQASNTNTTPLASQKSSQSQSNLEKRALTAPRSPETIRKESFIQHRYNTRSSSKNFPSSSLGPPPKLARRPRSASTSSPLKTPTRRTVKIAATPSHLHQYLPEDSQEDDATHSPPKLDSANVPASGKEDRKGKSVPRSSQPAKDEPKSDSKGKSVPSSSSHSKDEAKPDSKVKSKDNSKPDSKGKSKDEAKPESELAYDAREERRRRRSEVPVAPVERLMVSNDNRLSTTEKEHAPDKENSPAGLSDFKPFIARLPTFGNSNEPIKRRHTDSYKVATTPEPLKENKPKCKSAEANKTANDWFAVKPSNENILQPFQVRSPFTERRLNRNLLEDFKAFTPTPTPASDEISEMVAVKAEDEGILSLARDSSTASTSASNEEPTEKVIECSSEVIAVKAENEGTLPQTHDSSATPVQPSSLDSKELDKPTGEETTSPDESAVFQKPIDNVKRPMRPLLSRQKTSRHLEGPELDSEDENELLPEDDDYVKEGDWSWIDDYNKDSGAYVPLPHPPTAESSNQAQLEAPSARHNTSRKRKLEDEEAGRPRSVVPRKH